MKNKQEKENKSRSRFNFWDWKPVKLIDQICEKYIGIKPIEASSHVLLKAVIVIIASIVIITFFLGAIVVVIAGAVKGIDYLASRQAQNEYTKPIPEVVVPEVVAESNFNDDQWKESLGSFLRDEKDINYFALGPEKERALLKFGKSFLERQRIIFEFIPMSEDTINVVLNVNDLYEIVIGDNDYKTITLKARDTWDGVFQEIESEDGYKKKKIDAGIRRKTDVVLTMITECRVDGTYFVELGISFKPENVKTNEPQSLKVRYVFDTPFQECMSLEIGVGLINPKHSYIAAKFVSFSIEEETTY